MTSADEFKSEWYRNWREIRPDESDYIDEITYYEILDIIDITARRLLRQSNDSLKNHDLSIRVLQGPEYEFTTGSRFIRWLKKKLLPLKSPEILRITLDDKYFTDITMSVFTDIPEDHWQDIVAIPQLQRLIKKLKETDNDRTGSKD